MDYTLAQNKHSGHLVWLECEVCENLTVLQVQNSLDKVGPVENLESIISISKENSDNKVFASNYKDVLPTQLYPKAVRTKIDTVLTRIMLP